MVERIWRREGLKVPQKQPRKGRLWLNPSHRYCASTVGQWTGRASGCGRNARTMSGPMTLSRTGRTTGGYIARSTSSTSSEGGAPSRRCRHRLPVNGMIRVKRKLNSVDVVDALTDLFILRGPPEYIRSDNGAEFIAKKVRVWIGAVGAKTAFIAPGSPWENGSCESFNARFRDELLNGEAFYSLREAQILIEKWRRHYNTVRPHSALGYRPPAPESLVPIDQRPTMH